MAATIRGELRIVAFLSLDLRVRRFQRTCGLLSGVGGAPC
jgi:hypothetical protein